ncbi:MAG TPA: hypothetical protein VHI93_07465 [Candidatus Thermoplasmatota archaeon]|nr:hypothetical protein [Candidatus Thermoplasmatota archaeon]
MRLRPAFWTMAALLLLAAPALAAPGTLDGRATLPVEVRGDREVTGDGAFLLAGASGSVALELSGATGTLVRVQHRAYGYLSSQDPQAGLLWGAATERIAVPLAGATLTLQERQLGFQLYASDAALALAGTAAQGPLLLGGLAEEKRIEEDLQRPLTLQLVTDSDRFSAAVPAGLPEARAESGAATAAGALRLFLTQATFRLAQGGTVQEIPATFRVEQRPGQFYNPATGEWFGPGQHTEYVQESLQVEATGALGVRFAGLPGTLFAAAPAVQVTGVTAFPAFDGIVQVEGEDGLSTHALDGQELLLDGTYVLRLDRLDGHARTAHATGSGDLAAVAYGTVTARYPWGAAVAAAGLGALALAALAWATANGKALLGGAAGSGLLAGYARVHGEEILEHPGRAEVYERVRAAPGISLAELGSQVAFGASTLTHHLRALERNGYVHCVRDGRYMRLFDRRSGQYAGDRKVAVAALRNPTSAAMARHVREHPGVQQCELAAAFGVTASTVTWHMARLGAAGLVEKQRDGPHSRYYIARGWAGLPQDEQARQALPTPVTA